MIQSVRVTLDFSFNQRFTNVFTPLPLLLIAK